MEQIVSIRNLEELKKVLFIQKNVTQQAMAEMISLMSDGISNPRRPEEFFEDARVLLEKYAKYPTLTEFAHDPQLMNLTKWGATFGVSALVGGLILEQVKRSYPRFGPVMRQMFIILLSEMAKPQHSYLIEALEHALRVTPTEAGAAMTEEDAKTYIRSYAQQLTEAFVAVSVHFGLMSTAKDGIAITPVGRRVLLHMTDAQQFIDEMGAAHARFQASKPKLSMS
jgi:hypothetical protein